MSLLQEIVITQESVNDQTVHIVAVHADTGTRVSSGDAVIEIETSKSNIALESEHEGYVTCHVQVGDEIKVGSVVASIFSVPPEIDENPAGEPGISTPDQSIAETVFSDAAILALEEYDLKEDHFSGIPFVTESVVREFRFNHHVVESEKNEGELEEISTVFDPASLAELKSYIRADVFRYRNRTGFFVSFFCFAKDPGFRCTWFFRVRKYLQHQPLARVAIGPLLSFFGDRQARKFGIRIPNAAQVGRGLLIGHWGGIWINPKAVIGENCNLNNDVSIGSAGPAAKLGHPVIGNRVFIGPGARISGDIVVGSDSVVGANSFLTKSISRKSIVIGVPASVSSMSGSEGYISNILNSVESSQNELV